MSEPTLLQKQRQILQRFRYATQQRNQQEHTAQAYLNTERAEADEKLKQKQLITVVRQIKAIKEQEAQYIAEKKSTNEAWESVRSQADDCLGRVQKAKQSLQTILQKAGLESTIAQSSSLPLSKTKDKLGYYSLQSDLVQTKSPPSSLASNHSSSTELKNAAIRAEQELARFAENVKALLVARQAAIIRRNRFILASVVVAIILIIYGCNTYINKQEQRERQATIAITTSLLKSLENRFGIRFVMVPTGEFTMGSQDNEAKSDEKPQHQVNLDDFFISVTEITNGQFRSFIEDSGYTEQLFWSRDGWTWRKDNNRTRPGCWSDDELNQPEFPVVCITWYEALAYTRWLSIKSGVSIRLPTEAEWEKAARGTDGRNYPWGKETPTVERTNFGKNVDRTSAVGSYPTDISPYGVLDMAGNVKEWTNDWYDATYYSISPNQNPMGPYSGKSVTIRGGSWISTGIDTRVSKRSPSSVAQAYPAVGFRVVGVVPSGR